jgi:hypothetical protein
MKLYWLIKFILINNTNIYLIKPKIRTYILQKKLLYKIKIVQIQN